MDRIKRYLIGSLALVVALTFVTSMAFAEDNTGDGTADKEMWTARKACKGKERGAAAIHSNGTVASCWKCNKSAAETGRLAGTGTYEVDWFPKFKDVRAIKGYCRQVQADTLVAGTTNAYGNTADRAGDISSIWVNWERHPSGATNTAFFMYLLK